MTSRGPLSRHYAVHYAKSPLRALASPPMESAINGRLSVATGGSEDRARFRSHRARTGRAFALGLDDIAAPVGRQRRPGNDQDAILIVTHYPLGKLDLDRRSRRDDTLDGGARGYSVVGRAHRWRIC